MGQDNRLIKSSGIITTCKGNGFFEVLSTIKNQELKVLCRIAGKMKKNNITVVEGDSVDIEVNVDDVSKGRIIYRRK